MKAKQLTCVGLEKQDDHMLGSLRSRFTLEDTELYSHIFDDIFNHSSASDERRVYGGFDSILYFPFRNGNRSLWPRVKSLTFFKINATQTFLVMHIFASRCCASLYILKLVEFSDHDISLLKVICRLIFRTKRQQKHSSTTPNYRHQPRSSVAYSYRTN